MSYMSAKETALVVAAHPDDEVLGAGGTMAKLSAAGYSVYVVIVATGAAARYANPGNHVDQIASEIAVLKENVSSTGPILGVKRHVFLDYPDNRLDTVPLMDISHSLKEIVKDINPSIVFTHHHGDYNWDHRVVHEATLMACRANQGERYPRAIYSYEVLSSTERSFRGGEFAFVPNVYVDITGSIQKKIGALKCYTSELGEYPHPRSVEAVKNKALSRGSEVNVNYCEAFQLVRSIHMENLYV